MKKLDNKSRERLRLRVRQFHTKIEKPIGKTPDLSQLFMKLGARGGGGARGMKFCTQVPRTYVYKRLVLDFLFLLP